MRVSEIIPGVTYYLVGNILNGGRRDEKGNWIPYIDKEQVTREIKSINLEKGVINCVCGRQFLIDDDLIINGKKVVW